MEEDFVDLRVTLPDRDVLIEVKSDDDAGDALKKAVGQVLYYAHFGTAAGTNPLEMVVVAPGNATPDVKAYVERLRQIYSLPLRYVSYVEGSGRFEI
jgi:hypothetical protein